MKTTNVPIKKPILGDATGTNTGRNMKMEILTTKKDDVLTVSLTGRLDTTTSPQLDEELKKSLDGIRELTMDLEGLDYISSAGLRILLSTQKTMNQQGTMKLINVSSMVMDVFEVTGFSDILTIE